MDGPDKPGHDELVFPDVTQGALQRGQLLVLLRFLRSLAMTPIMLADNQAHTFKSRCSRSQAEMTC